MIVERRVAGIAKSLDGLLKQKAREFCYFFLAIDESIDLEGPAQLLIFSRGVNEKFEVTEDLAGLYSGEGRTVGKNIALEVKKCINEKTGLSFESQQHFAGKPIRKYH